MWCSYKALRAHFYVSLQAGCSICILGDWVDARAVVWVLNLSLSSQSHVCNVPTCKLFLHTGNGGQDKWSVWCRFTLYIYSCTVFHVSCFANLRDRFCKIFSSEKLGAGIWRTHVDASTNFAALQIFQDELIPLSIPVTCLITLSSKSCLVHICSASGFMPFVHGFQFSGISASSLQPQSQCMLKAWPMLPNFLAWPAQLKWHPWWKLAGAPDPNCTHLGTALQRDVSPAILVGALHPATNVLVPCRYDLGRGCTSLNTQQRLHRWGFCTPPTLFVKDPA